jgi:hypothetical protein
MEKLEFGSSAYFAELRRVIEKAIATEDLSGITSILCEEFTNPPAHLRRNGSSSIGWHWRVNQGRSQIGEGVIDAAFKIVIDYETAHIIARRIFGPEGGEVPEMPGWVAEGKVRIEGDRTGPLPTLAQKLNFHNLMAVKTA